MAQCSSPLPCAARRVPRSSPARAPQALSLLDYLIRNGSERVIDDARDHVYQIRTLNDFQYTEPGTGVDHGINGASAVP